MGEHTAASFDITWRDGAYYVSVPNYQGGTVYTKDTVEALVSAIRDYLETFDRCGGSESVSAEDFADCRKRMRDIVGGQQDG